MFRPVGIVFTATRLGVVATAGGGFYMKDNFRRMNLGKCEAFRFPTPEGMG